jgi:hypothetical protein
MDQKRRGAWVTGLLWWFLGPLTIMPIWLGKPVDWSATRGSELFGSLVGHIIYGLIVGLVYAAVDRLWLRFFTQRYGCCPGPRFTPPHSVGLTFETPKNFLDELVARTGCALLLWAFCSIDRRKRSPSVHFSRWAQRAERSLVGRRITTKQAYSSPAELRKVVIRMQVTPTPPLIWFHLPEHWIRWTVVSTANRSVGHERRSSTRCAGGGARYGRRCGQPTAMAWQAPSVSRDGHNLSIKPS